MSAERVGENTFSLLDYIFHLCRNGGSEKKHNAAYVVLNNDELKIYVPHHLLITLQNLHADYLFYLPGVSFKFYLPIAYQNLCIQISTVKV